jgi:hypothetical protein
VGYPIAIITLITISIFDLNKIIPSDYFLIGGILFLSSFILSPIGLTDIKIIKVLQKGLIGMGAILFFFLDILNS